MALKRHGAVFRLMAFDEMNEISENCHFFEHPRISFLSSANF